MPPPRKNLAVYQAAAEKLRARIRAGDFGTGPDAWLPSEKRLAEELDVHPLTARKALLVLANEGLIETLPRRGSRVRQPRGVRWPMNAIPLPVPPDLLATAETTVRTASPDNQAGGHEIGTLLGGAGLLVCRSLSIVEGDDLLAVIDVYVDYQAVKDTAFMDQAAPLDLEPVLGAITQRPEDQIIPRVPTPAESDRLELLLPLPILELVRTIHGERHTCVVHGLFVADATVFVHDIPLD